MKPPSGIPSWRPSACASTLYQNNGNDVLELTATDPNAEVFFDGLYGVYDPVGVPGPAPAILVLLGVAGIMLRRLG